MLVAFTVKNFRSIRDSQTLSMVASSDRENRNTHTCASGIRKPARLIRSAVIYGPNAAGKSNVLNALDFMKSLVVNSAASPPTADGPHDPFQLSSLTRHAPSEFEISFVQDAVLYKYSFKMTSKRVFEESLLEYPANRGRHLFTRTYSENRNVYEWSFSPFLRGNRALWRDSTRENALFLSTAAQLNSGQLLPVFSWFQRRLVMIAGIEGFNSSLTLRLLATPEGKLRVLPFLREADLGIADIQVQREPFPALAGRTGSMFMRVNNDQYFVEQSAPNASPEMVKVSFAHKVNDGDDNVQFD